MKSKSSKGISRYERNGVILLVFLILLAVVSKQYVVDYFTKDVKPTSNDQEVLMQLQAQIAAAKTSSANTYSSRSESKHPSAFPVSSVGPSAKPYKSFTIEVNSATQADYERLYGIGKVYADRIVKFRDKLGGFSSIHQIKDVWGIEDTTFEKFKHQLTIKPVSIKKININTATYEELTANPYFFSTIAKQIIGYRTKVKPFANVEDIRNLYYIKDHPEQFDKLAPYVKVE